MNLTETKILICDDSADYGVRLASGLRELGAFAYTRKKDSETIVKTILSEKPDIVVSELSLNDSDAIGIMQRIKTIISQCPQFIVIMDFENSFVERQILETGADLVLAKPVEVNVLYDAIRVLAVKKVTSDSDEAEVLVTNLIRSLGIPAHIKGYRYIRTAILECIKNRGLLDSMTKQLYPLIADIYKTTSSRVERAIRHAIESAWFRCDKEIMKLFLGYNADEYNIRPTNSEFIALAADRIHLHLRFPSENTNLPVNRNNIIF